MYAESCCGSGYVCPEYGWFGAEPGYVCPVYACSGVGSGYVGWAYVKSDGESDGESSGGSGAGPVYADSVYIDGPESGIWVPEVSVGWVYKGV